jgi:hypothetical protein
MLEELPGDVWSISKEESHCLLEALERVGAFAGEDGPIASWRQILSLGARLVTPWDDDRAFMEGLVASEIARLWTLEAESELACGCSADEHIALLRTFSERELELPKRYAEARAARQRAFPAGR